jgi:hypothetical protein
MAIGGGSLMHRVRTNPTLFFSENKLCMGVKKFTFSGTSLGRVFNNSTKGKMAKLLIQ